MTLSGFGGRAIPVATILSQFGDYIDFSVKQRTLQGAKIMGQ
jgi:hypothetical protein